MILGVIKLLGMTPLVIKGRTLLLNWRFHQDQVNQEGQSLTFGDGTRGVTQNKTRIISFVVYKYWVGTYTLCVYIYLYTYKYIYIYISISIQYINSYMFIYIYIYLYPYLYLSMYLHTHMPTVRSEVADGPRTGGACRWTVIYRPLPLVM